jgi:hypothetical protein
MNQGTFLSDEGRGHFYPTLTVLCEKACPGAVTRTILHRGAYPCQALDASSTS